MNAQHWDARYYFIHFPNRSPGGGVPVEVHFHNGIDLRGTEAKVYARKRLIWDGPFRGEPTVKDAQLLAFKAWNNPRTYPDETIPG